MEFTPLPGWTNKTLAGSFLSPNLYELFTIGCGRLRIITFCPID